MCQQTFRLLPCSHQVFEGRVPCQDASPSDGVCAIISCEWLLPIRAQEMRMMNGKYLDCFKCLKKMDKEAKDQHQDDSPNSTIEGYDGTVSGVAIASPRSPLKQSTSSRHENPSNSLDESSLNPESPLMSPFPLLHRDDEDEVPANVLDVQNSPSTPTISDRSESSRNKGPPSSASRPDQGDFLSELGEKVMELLAPEGFSLNGTTESDSPRMKIKDELVKHGLQRNETLRFQLTISKTNPITLPNLAEGAGAAAQGIRKPRRGGPDPLQALYEGRTLDSLQAAEQLCATPDTLVDSPTSPSKLETRVVSAAREGSEESSGTSKGQSNGGYSDARQCVATWSRQVSTAENELHGGNLTGPQGLGIKQDSTPESYVLFRNNKEDALNDLQANGILAEDHVSRQSPLLDTDLPGPSQLPQADANGVVQLESTGDESQESKSRTPHRPGPSSDPAARTTSASTRRSRAIPWSRSGLGRTLPLGRPSAEYEADKDSSSLQPRKRFGSGLLSKLKAKKQTNGDSESSDNIAVGESTREKPQASIDAESSKHPGVKGQIQKSWRSCKRSLNRPHTRARARDDNERRKMMAQLEASGNGHSTVDQTASPNSVQVVALENTPAQASSSILRGTTIEDTTVGVCNESPMHRRTGPNSNASTLVSQSHRPVMTSDRSRRSSMPLSRISTSRTENNHNAAAEPETRVVPAAEIWGNDLKYWLDNFGRGDEAPRLRHSASEDLLGRTSSRQAAMPTTASATGSTTDQGGPVPQSPTEPSSSLTNPAVESELEAPSPHGTEPPKREKGKERAS